MKKLLVLPFLFVVLSCNNSPKKIENQAESAVAIGAKPDAIAVKELSAKEELSGSWANVDTAISNGNVIFRIDKTTFFYPEHSLSYKYKIISADSLTIAYDDFEGRFSYSFKGPDTLMLSGEDGPGYYKRINK